MTFDGFDAALLIESSQAVPQLLPAEPAEGLTLQRAMAEYRDTLAPDLWARDSRGTLGEPQLRALSPDEMLLIAGGAGSEFTITGPDDWEWNFPPPDDGGGGGGWGGGGGQDPHQQTEDANDTPCVDEVPAGVDLDHLNDLAKFLGTKLGGLQDATGWEWGALIYRGSDGELYQSEPFTAQHPNDLIGATITLPDGAHVVGYVHSHPTDPDSDQRNLSTADRTFISNLINNGQGTVTADVNLVAYVVTKDRDLGYADNYSTFAYDKSKRTSTSPGCTL